MSSWSAIPPIDVVVAKCVALNHELVNRFGGSHTSPAPEVCLDKVISAAQNAEYYAGNEEASGLCYIGALMFYAIEGHCFLDGNKRTGLAIALWLLKRFGLTLICSQEDARDYCLAVASGLRSREQVVLWLAENLIAIEVNDPPPQSTPGRRFRPEE
jgi:prophage maintenance system killer protein